MKKTISFVLVLASVLIISCDNPSQNPQLLIGKWKDSSTDNILEFHENGTMTGSFLSKEPKDTPPGKYAWSDNNHIEMAWSGKALGQIERTSYVDIPIGITVEITDLSQDTLKMTLQGNLWSYSRVSK
jgi:hypothetical protein